MHLRLWWQIKTTCQKGWVHNLAYFFNPIVPGLNQNVASFLIFFYLCGGFLVRQHWHFTSNYSNFSCSLLLLLLNESVLHNHVYISQSEVSQKCIVLVSLQKLKYCIRPSIETIQTTASPFAVHVFMTQLLLLFKQRMSLFCGIFSKVSRVSKWLLSVTALWYPSSLMQKSIC